MAATFGNNAPKNAGKSKPLQRKQPTKPPTPLLSEYEMRPLTPVLSEDDMKQLRLWKESLQSEREQKAGHWDYAPKQNPALPETAPRPSKDWSPKLNSNPTPKSKNHHTEEQIDALLKQGMATITKAARADGLLAEDNLNKLRLAIIKDLTASQAWPNEQDSESPEHRRTKERSLALPRRASRSPDHSRAPYEIVDYQPLKGRTSRSPTRRKPTYARDLSGRREESPSGYRVDRHINLDGDYTRICAVNRFWRINKNPVTKRMILFNAPFSGERIRNIEEPYAKTEEFAFFRDDALHPFYREPYEDDELTLWTRNTSGIEVLHSVLIPRHPTRFTHVHVFSCTTKDWLVPVIKERIKANTMAHYLAAKLKPFYSEGKGEIMCPVCISYIVAEKFWPVRFTRKEFVAHQEWKCTRLLRALPTWVSPRATAPACTKPRLSTPTAWRTPTGMLPKTSQPIPSLGQRSPGRKEDLPMWTASMGYSLLPC
jgi:hypothetical protein